MRARAGWVCAVAFVSLGACAAPPQAVGPIPPGLSAQRYEVLQRVAAGHLNCTADQLTYETFANGRHVFKGCGDEAEMILLEGRDAKAYNPGFEMVAVPSPTYRFAKETGCAWRKSTHERIDYRTRVVSGCGKRITYVNVGDRTGYSWIANVESTTR